MKITYGMCLVFSTNTTMLIMINLIFNEQLRNGLQRCQWQCAHLYNYFDFNYFNGNAFHGNGYECAMFFCCAITRSFRDEKMNLTCGANHRHSKITKTNRKCLEYKQTVDFTHTQTKHTFAMELFSLCSL